MNGVNIAIIGQCYNEEQIRMLKTCTVTRRCFQLHEIMP
jgi:hypothetical protein